MYPRFFKRVLDFCCALATVWGMCPLLMTPSQLSAATSPAISANPQASFSNGNAYLQQGIPLLFQYHSLTTGDSRQRFGYPQRNYGYIESMKSGALWQGVTDSTISLQFGIDGNLHLGAFSQYQEYSSETDKIFPGGFAGISASGYIDSLDFDLNVALYAERHNHDNPPSVDRLETDWVVWDNDGHHIVNYKRYQGHLGFNYSWLRLELGRDALHWGPGFYNNLTLNRQAVPYGYFSVDMVFGPLRIISFYGSLEIDSVGSKIHSDNSRNLYGHRYELALGNLTFGMSEIQVIYNNNNPWLLVPVFPQFMEKGNYTERSNNGALSFDANYRIMRMARIYGEFYVDDFDSPMSIIQNEYLDNEWAFMVGGQFGYNLTLDGLLMEFGSIFEYSHIEQLVYTHYSSNQGQMANAGFPLGNQYGPNSQTIDWTLYALVDNSFIFTLHNKWIWKGTVFGSYLNETMIPGMADMHKHYLDGATMHYSIMPMIAYEKDHVGISAGASFIYESSLLANITLKW